VVRAHRVMMRCVQKEALHAATASASLPYAWVQQWKQARQPSGATLPVHESAKKPGTVTLGVTMVVTVPGPLGAHSGELPPPPAIEHCGDPPDGSGLQQPGCWFGGHGSNAPLLVQLRSAPGAREAVMTQVGSEKAEGPHCGSKSPVVVSVVMPGMVIRLR
jgi:hypothetical protein